MNFTSLFALLFPPLFDQIAAKVIHQVAGTAKGDDILKKDGAAISALKMVAQPYIAQQVGLHLQASSPGNVTRPGSIGMPGTLNLSQFVPPAIEINQAEVGGQPD